MTDSTSYAEPHNPGLPPTDFALDPARAALVVTDPQIDFLSPDGAAWPVFGDSIRENDTVAHIGALLRAINGFDGQRTTHAALQLAPYRR